MIRKIKIISLIVGVIIFSGCSNDNNKTEIEKLEYSYDTTNKDVTFRVNSLYEHTKIMIQLSDDEKLEEIKLNKDFITDDIFLSIEKKIENMEKAFGVNTQIDLENRVVALENRMDEMMDTWN